MSEADLDEQVARVVRGLLQCRRALDPASFDSMLGSLQLEIQHGLDIAEEEALEAAHRQPASGNIVAFPGGGPHPGNSGGGR